MEIGLPFVLFLRYNVSALKNIFFFVDAQNVQAVDWVGIIGNYWQNCPTALKHSLKTDPKLLQNQDFC